MADTPFPIARQKRETDILVGNGGASYGPFNDFWIFDPEDAKVWAKPAGAVSFLPVSGVMVSKVNAGVYSPFSITFPAPVPATTKFVVRGRRTPTRDVSVLRGGSVSSVQLEAELSRIAATQQELVRDSENAWRADPGQQGGYIYPGPVDHMAVYDEAGNIGKVPDFTVKSFLASVANAFSSAGASASSAAAALVSRAQAAIHEAGARRFSETAAGYAQDAVGVSGVFVPLFTSSTTAAGNIIRALVNTIQTLTGGAPRYSRMSLADIVAAGYPALAYYRSNDRVMPDGTVDPINGGYWVLRNDQRITPFMFTAREDGTDASFALQAFFDYLAVVRADDNDASGSFSVASGLFIGRASGTTQTLSYNGYMRLTALAPIRRMITTRNMQTPVWNGQLQGIGTGATAFAGRTCEVFIYNTGASRMKITGGFQASRFSYAGYTDIKGATNTSLADLGNVRAYLCGAVTTVASGAPVANWTARTKAGLAGNLGQTDTLDVTAMPPAMVDDYIDIGSGQLFARIGSDLYFVNGLDRANNKVTVFPWLPSDAVPGQITYIFGGSVCVPGGSDHNVHGISQLDASYCGIALGIGCLYPPTSERIVTQACSIGLAFGNRPLSSCLGGETKALYLESNTYDIVGLSNQLTAGVYHKISSEYAMTLSKIMSLAPRLADDSFDPRYTGLGSISLNYKGRQYDFEKPEKGGISGSRYGLIMARAFRILAFKTNSWIVDINPLDLENMNRLFGYDSAGLLFHGTGANGAPTGSFVFNPPNGATLNGGANATFAGFTGPVFFDVKWDRLANNYEVLKVTG